MLVRQFLSFGDRMTVSLAGEIYAEDAAVLKEELFEQLRGGTVNIEVEMTKVSYIDSSGLGVLVAVQKQAIQSGGRVILRGLNGIVSELFQITRLNKVFEIQP